MMAPPGVHGTPGGAIIDPYPKQHAPEAAPNPT